MLADSLISTHVVFVVTRYRANVGPPKLADAKLQPKQHDV